MKTSALKPGGALGFAGKAEAAPGTSAVGVDLLRLVVIAIC